MRHFITNSKKIKACYIHMSKKNEKKNIILINIQKV